MCKNILRPLLLGLILAAPAHAQDHPFGKHGTPTGTRSGEASSAFQSVANAAEANLFTGAAGTKIDIVVPPGRDKMTPKVSVEYSSTGGRSGVGFGWTVPVAKISRSTKNGVPRFKDTGSDADVFVLDLNGSSTELVYSAGYLYQARIEGAFLKIWYDSDNNFWKVNDRDGTEYFFGETFESKLGPVTAGSNGTSVWLLSRAQDFAGNTIEYQYTTLNTHSQAGLPRKIFYGGHVNPSSNHQYQVEFIWEDPAIDYPTLKPVSFSEGYPKYSRPRLKTIYTQARHHYENDDSGYDYVREYNFQHEVDTLATNSWGIKGTGTGIISLIAVGLTAHGMEMEQITIPPTVFEYSRPLVAVCSGNDKVSCQRDSDCSAAGAGQCSLRGGWSHGTQSTSFWGSVPQTDAPEEEVDGRFRDRIGEAGKAKFDSIDLNNDGIVDYLHADTPSRDEVTVRWGAVDENGYPSLGTAQDWHWPANLPGRVEPLTQQLSNSGELRVSIFDLTGDGFPELVDTSFARCKDACGTTLNKWCYYPQTKDATGWPNGFANNPVCWDPPKDVAGDVVESIRVSSGGKIISDLVDFDGDGRPDLISSSHAAPGWAYAENTGNGFADRKPIAIPSTFYENVGLAPNDFFPVGSDHGEGGVQQWSLLDINGDGLRDVVIPHGPASSSSGRLDSQSLWRVYLNQGGFRSSPQRTTFATNPETWRVEGGTYGLPEKIAVKASDGGASISDLVDLTGDGLPDLVRRHTPGAQTPTSSAIPYRCDGQGGGPDLNSDGKRLSQTDCWNMLLYVNTGSSFAAPVAWRSPTNAVRADYQNCVDTTSNLGGCYELMDFNGDGLVDLVANAWGGKWGFLLHPSSPSVVPGETRTKPNLLTAMLNGMGGETVLEYTPLTYLQDHAVPFPYWVVSRIDKSDAFSESLPFTIYGYTDADYDVQDREFRGFGLVRATNQLGLSTVTEFNQDDRRKGIVSRKTTYGAIAPSCPGESDLGDSDPCDYRHYKLSVEDYDWGASATYQSNPLPLVKAWEKVRTFRPGKAGSSGTPQLLGALTRKTTFTYVTDGVGRAINGNEKKRVLTFGAGEANAFSTTENWYVDQWSTSGNSMSEKWLPSRPSRSVTTDNQTGLVLAELEYDYYSTSSADNAKVSEARSCQSWGTSGSCSKWSSNKYKYDNHGNLSEHRSPTDGLTTLNYSGGRHQYATSVKDPVLLKTTTYYDNGTGKLIQTTDPNGFVVNSRFDGLGRPIKSWPEQSGWFDRNYPQEEYTYSNPVGGCSALDCSPPYLAPNKPASVTHIVRDGYVYAGPPTVTFYSGFGEVHAVKSIAETSTNDFETLVSKLRQYNSSGQLVQESGTFVSGNENMDVLDDGIEDAPAVTRFEYDQHGRLVASKLPDHTTGNVSMVRYLVDEPGVKVTLDPNLNANESGRPGAATVESFDAFGRKTSVETCVGEPVSPYKGCSGTTSITRTDYTYDVFDRVTKIEQRVDPASSNAKATLRTTTYDGLGNVALTADYDAGPTNLGTGPATPGISFYDYDLAGNITDVTRPDGSWTHNDYDPANRLLKSKTRKNGLDTSSVVYRYGRSMKRHDVGRVYRVTNVTQHSSNEQTKIEKRITYDLRGNVATEKRRSKSNRYGSTKWLLTSYTYSEGGSLETVTYPGSGSAKNTIYTERNLLGQPTSLYEIDRDFNPLKTYVSDVDFDIHGHVTHIAYGNGVHDFATYAGPEENLRLRCLRTTTSTAVPECSAANSSTDFQALSYADYDKNGRVKAINDLLWNGLSASGNKQEFSYDELGRLAQAKYNNGSAGTDVYDYDALGRMKSGPGGNYSYPAQQRHRLMSIGSGPTAVTFGYDENGNRTSKSGKYFEYDGLNRLVETGTGSTVAEENVYDDTGARTIRYAGGKTRHTVAGGLIEFDDNEFVRYFFLGGRRVAMDRVAVPSGIWAGTVAGKGDQATLRSSLIAAARDRLISSRATLELSGQIAVFLLLIGGAVLVCSASGRRGRVAAATATAFLGMSLPYPWISVAEAQTTPATLYFHTDHLGSSQVMTNEASGSVAARTTERVRYRAYGKTRCVNDNCTGSVQPNVSRTFTGHDNDAEAGLIYMGARHYDPDVGDFLTFDPASQFASPYAYAGYNPANLTDPTGAYVPIAEIVTTLAVVTAVFIDSMIQSEGDWGASVKAAGIAGFTNSLGGVGTILNASMTKADIGETVLSQTVAPYSLYKTFADGNYVSGAVAVIQLAMMVYGLYQTYGGSADVTGDGGAAGMNGSSGSNVPNAFQDGDGLPRHVIEILRPDFAPDFDFDSITMVNGFPEDFQSLAGTNPDAMARGNTIYIRNGSYQPNTAQGIGLLGHEVKHIEQVRQAGGQSAFNRLYKAELKQLKSYGLSDRAAYQSVSFEMKAYLYQDSLMYKARALGY